MEYPRNTMYYPNNTFGRRSQIPQNFAVGAASNNAKPKNPCLEGASLAMVYSPCQHFEKLYEPMEGLRRGTIFCALDMPFTGNRK